MKKPIVTLVSLWCLKNICSINYAKLTSHKARLTEHQTVLTLSENNQVENLVTLDRIYQHCVAQIFKIFVNLILCLIEFDFEKFILLLRNVKYFIENRKQ